MKVSVSQIYIEPGIWFPFSHIFQRWVSGELSAMVKPSTGFLRRYGDEYAIVFNLSAKPVIKEIEIRGPTVFKKTKDVEYSLFLPYDSIVKSDDKFGAALRSMFGGIVRVLDELGIDTQEVSRRTESMVRHICSDPSMIDDDDEDLDA